LKYGEALRILVVDKNKKSTKEFINFLLTVLIIPLLIEIILEVRRYKK